MPINQPSQNDPKSHRAIVGAALHALRAHAKAHTMKANSDVAFRYELAADDSRGFIFDPAGKLVAQGTLEQWAESGRPIRSALIGLKYMKERVEQACDFGFGSSPVRYSMDALSDSASLCIDKFSLTRDELLKRSRELWLSEAALRILESMDADAMDKLSGWAKLGHQLEIDYYRALHGAERHELTGALMAERQRGYRLGIFRRKLNESTPT